MKLYRLTVLLIGELFNNPLSFHSSKINYCNSCIRKWHTLGLIVSNIHGSTLHNFALFALELPATESQHYVTVGVGIGFGRPTAMNG